MIAISPKGIALIKEFEGFVEKAAPCPAGVPTFGYGTTRYPDGRPVQLGDEISEDQAEAFLADECNGIAREIAQLVKMPLNQNQADALISFCYNLGCGAFAESTLLQHLNQGDYQGATNEFPKWNKAKVNGVKTELPGLTRRRMAEKALFETIGNEGEAIQLEPSPQDKVTWLELYRLEDGNHLLAAWNEGELIELIGFNRPLKEDLIAALTQYKNARNIHLAPAGKAIPPGEIIKLEGTDKDVPPPEKVPPDLEEKILVRGSTGNAVNWLQERLDELGYYSGSIDGDFGRATDDAVRRFQADVFGSAGADGKVGPKTWKALIGEPQKLIPKTMPAGTYLYLTKTASKDSFGCYKLRLAYIKEGQEVDHIFVCSGQPKRQFFRIGRESKAQSYEPLPEGKWHVGDLQWKEGKDNYSRQVSWGTGLGPVKSLLTYKEPDKTQRSAILIHLDWNRPPYGNAPGTAGCIGIYDVADCKRLVRWLRETDPRDLYVDWGLGSCPKPTPSTVFV